MSVSKELLEQLRGQHPWRAGIDKSVLNRLEEDRKVVPDDRVVVVESSGGAQPGSINSITDLRTMASRAVFGKHTHIIREGAKQLAESGGVTKGLKARQWYSNGLSWYVWVIAHTRDGARTIGSSGGTRTARGTGTREDLLTYPLQHPLKKISATKVPDSIAIGVTKFMERSGISGAKPKTPGLSKAELAGLIHIRKISGDWSFDGYIDPKNVGGEKVLKQLAKKKFIQPVHTAYRVALTDAGRDHADKWRSD